MNKRLSASLMGLYLLPWGIQCLVNNFMPLYVASLPFATEKTVGQVAALGAAVTIGAQMLWTFAAGRAKNMENVLALSLGLLALFTLPFFKTDMSKPWLYVFVILFYGCYMVHQPLIDTIAAGKAADTGHPFSFFRSFASFGYAVIGLVFTLLPHGKPTVFLLYILGLALLSALLAKLASGGNGNSFREKVPQPMKTDSTDIRSNGNCGIRSIGNPGFVKFLVYTFVLFVCSSAISAFFPVYYVSEQGLKGDVGIFSLLVSLSTFAEWLVILAFGKIAGKWKQRHIFMICAGAGVLRSSIIFLADRAWTASLSVLFAAVWFGVLWSAATPYIKRQVQDGSFSFAQGVWNVAASGAGTFTGSWIGGIVSEAFGMKMLFGGVSILLLVLTGVTPLLIRQDA